MPKFVSLIIISFLLIAAAILLVIKFNQWGNDKNSDDGFVQDGERIYVNTAKGIKYVGSEKCALCHKNIYDSFMEAEMGRSMEKLDTTNIIEEYPQKEAVYDSVNNFYYEMVKRDNRFYQREYRLNEQGKLIHERWMEAQYSIGSGNNLRMYFYDENGMFYQLPLTWYTYQNKWELSPGYRRVGNVRFMRYVTKKCMSCHNSYLEESPTANHRFLKPYTLGIGCERCHGPGELHVRQWSGKDIGEIPRNAWTIVNPRKLSSKRQLSVCMQCHLQGKGWALHGEKGWFDFRPGRLLESHRSVYFPEKTRKEIVEVGDAPHRLMLSKCFTESQGSLTCPTCHNPHFSIKTFTREHYNEKCLSCHLSQDLPSTNSAYAHTASDNCISCHMNRTGKENTLHGVSLTDHWIRVDANKTTIDWAYLRQPSRLKPLVKLATEIDAQDRGKLIRRGIAYLDFYNGFDKRTAYLDSALTYLGEGLKRNSSDAIGYYHLGEVNCLLSKYQAAISALQQSIALKPNYSEAHFKLAESYLSIDKLDSAISSYRRALRIKPDEPEYLEGLGAALIEKGDFQGASGILERAISIDSQNAYTFYQLGNLYALQFQEPRKALAFFKEAVVLDPDLHNGYLNLGNTYASLGQYRNAIDSYKKELFYRPDFAPVYLNLGQVYKLTGKDSDARDFFQKALEIDPSLNVARQYLKESPE